MDLLETQPSHIWSPQLGRNMSKSSGKRNSYSRASDSYPSEERVGTQDQGLQQPPDPGFSSVLAFHSETRDF